MTSYYENTSSFPNMFENKFQFSIAIKTYVILVIYILVSDIENLFLTTYIHTTFHICVVMTSCVLAGTF